MKKITITLLLFFLFANGRSFSQDLKKEFPKSFQVKVTNPLKVTRENALVHIPADQLKKSIPDFNQKAFVVLDGEKEIPSQYNINDQDYPGIVTVLETLKPGEVRSLTIRFMKTGESKRTYPKRT